MKRDRRAPGASSRARADELLRDARIAPPAGARADRRHGLQAGRRRRARVARRSRSPRRSSAPGCEVAYHDPLVPTRAHAPARHASCDRGRATRARADAATSRSSAAAARGRRPASVARACAATCSTRPTASCRSASRATYGLSPDERSCSAAAVQPRPIDTVRARRRGRLPRRRCSSPASPTRAVVRRRRLSRRRCSAPTASSSCTYIISRFVFCGCSTGRRATPGMRAARRDRHAGLQRGGGDRRTRCARCSALDYPAEQARAGRRQRRLDRRHARADARASPPRPPAACA